MTERWTNDSGQSHTWSTKYGLQKKQQKKTKQVVDTKCLESPAQTHSQEGTIKTCLLDTGQVRNS